MARKREEPRQTEWRYQPVVVDDEFVMLCECYFDRDDKLVSWEAEPGSPAAGLTVAELADDLNRMLAATGEWRPVRFEDLRVGMVFERTGVESVAKIGAEVGNHQSG